MSFSIKVDKGNINTEITVWLMYTLVQSNEQKVSFKNWEMIF